MKFNKDIEQKIKQLSDLISEESLILNSDGAEIKTGFFSLQINQLERNDKKINCILYFGNKFTLFFDDLEKSINSTNNPPDNRKFENDDLYNNYYIDKILAFFSTNKNEVFDFPPTWFLTAVKISSERLARNFPDLAVKHKKEGEAVWLAWGLHFPAK